MTYKNTSKMIIIATLLVVILTISFAAFMPGIALAVDNYTDVLTDLKSDPNFDASKYVENRTDYSVNVIQIAEGERGNLFVYTYQPCRIIKSLKASKINMSLSKSVDGTKLYELKFVSKDGVFAKYEVVDFEVSPDPIRYYNISTVYRPWLAGVDAKADADKNVTNAVAYKVGQLWTATTENDTVVYGASEVEVVTVTSQMVGFRRYSDGFQFAGTKNCDSHFLAFSCDHEIDKLLNADIEFVTTPYKRMEGQEPELGESTNQKVTLDHYQVASNDGSGWFGDKKDWHRISSVADYLAEVPDTSNDHELEEALSKYDWILNFYETDYERSVGGKDILISLLVPFGFVDLIVQSCTTRGTFVTDVTLLRMEFEYGGEIYNLGVVADSQTGDKEPVGGDSKSLIDKIKQWFEDNKKGLIIAGSVIIAVVVIIIVVLLIVLLKPTGGSSKVYFVQQHKKSKPRKASKKSKK